MNKRDFRKLQKKWYAKLAKEGFKDLEVSQRTGNFREIGMLQGANIHQIKNTYERRSFGAQLLNRVELFLVHNPNYPFGATRMWERWILELYSEGVSMRKILAKFNSGELIAFKKKVHLPTIHEVIHSHLGIIKKWYEHIGSKL